MLSFSYLKLIFSSLFLQTVDLSFNALEQFLKATVHLLDLIAEVNWLNLKTHYHLP